MIAKVENMTRKRWNKLSVALCENLGEHLSGENLKFYRDRTIKQTKCKSYKEAWEMLKPIRDIVGM